MPVLFVFTLLYANKIIFKEEIIFIKIFVNIVEHCFSLSFEKHSKTDMDLYCLNPIHHVFQKVV